MFGFSNRLQSVESGLNPLAAALASARAHGESVLDLTQSNPTTAGLRYPDAEISEAISGDAILTYRPSPQGLRSAREAICRYYADRGRQMDPDDLILTASTSEAYSFLLKLLCNPGDEVGIPTPSYPLLDYLADLEGVRLRTYPLHYGEPGPRWHTDSATLDKLPGGPLRALILVNPNNPTGSLLTGAETSWCLDWAGQHHAALVVDEVFSDYCLDGRVYQPVCSDEGLVLTLNGFSKILGLPQLKLGWIHIGGASSLKERARHLLEIIADTFLSVNTPVQVATRRLLALRNDIQTQIHRRLRENLRRLEIAVAGCTELSLLPPEAGWYAVLALNTVASEEAVALTLLRKYGVYVYPGEFFGFVAGCHLILSLLTPDEEFEAGVGRIMDYATRRML